MNTRVVAALSLLGVAVPASSAAQSGAPVDYMAMIEGAQASAGSNGLCALTLEDLSKPSEAFLSVLAGLHHQRIEYPESTETSRPAVRVARSAWPWEMPGSL